MEQFLDLIFEMSPYLLLGFLIAGLMHAFIPSWLYSRYLSQPNMKSVALAALMGIPLPLCSCGVIPTAMSLRREGASKGATTSFLIATPQTGVDSIFATYSLMGLPFAIIRPIAALVTALFGGMIVNLTEGEQGAGMTTEEHNDCQEHDDKKPHTLLERLGEALRYAFLDMMADIGKWLTVGLVVAGLITVFVPDSFFAVFRNNSLASMLLVLCIAIPMYVCATGSIPVAVALMMKGLTPGAGLVLLMAGPACNMASMLVINKVMGRRTLATYLASIVVGAISFGLIIDHLLPTEWFVSELVSRHVCCAEPHSWFSIACSLLLALLLANALICQRWFGQHIHHHDHNHDHATPNGQPLENQDDNDNNTYTMKQTIIINGMTCNHCRMTAEKAIRSVEGVTDATVDLASKQAVIEGDATFESISKAVEEVGFSCTRN